MHTCFVYLFSMWIECNAFCNVASFMVLDQPYFDYDFVLILKMWTNSFNFLFFCLHPSSQAYPSTYKVLSFLSVLLGLCLHGFMYAQPPSHAYLDPFFRTRMPTQHSKCIVHYCIASCGKCFPGVPFWNKSWLPAPTRYRGESCLIYPCPFKGHLRSVYIFAIAINLLVIHNFA